MNCYEFNEFCKALPSTTYVMQWGGSHVWKVGGKVFAIGGLGDGKATFTFKVDPFSYDMLQDMPGLRPAPYLASRGLKWIQHYGKPGLKEKMLKSYILESYKIICRGLSKKKQRELGLLENTTTL